MASLLDDSSCRDDTDHVGVADGGESAKEGGKEEGHGCECVVMATCSMICPVGMTQTISALRMVESVVEGGKEGRRKGGKVGASKKVIDEKRLTEEYKRGDKLTPRSPAYTPATHTHLSTSSRTHQHHTHPQAHPYTYTHLHTPTHTPTHITTLHPHTHTPTYRWATTMVVRFLLCMRLSKASCTTASLSESNADVASSNNNMAGSFKMARAIEIRCFCPPESCTPRSPTSVSYPLGKDKMKSCALAALAAAMTDSREAEGRPYAMFSAILPTKRIGCGGWGEKEEEEGARGGGKDEGKDVN